MKDKDNIHNQIIKDAIEGPDRPSHKNILVLVTGVFLLLLVLSYYLIGPYTFDIVTSLFSSSKVDHLTLQGNDFNVMFDADAYDDLKDVYLNTQEKEFKACLLGNISGNNYIITSFYLPEQTGVYNRVTYSSCSKETIASLHSHPYMHCRASEQDFVSFNDFRKRNPNAVMMIMCDQDRFFVYR